MPRAEEEDRSRTQSKNIIYYLLNIHFQKKKIYHKEQGKEDKLKK